MKQRDPKLVDEITSLPTGRLIDRCIEYTDIIRDLHVETKRDRDTIRELEAERDALASENQVFRRTVDAISNENAAMIDRCDHGHKYARLPDIRNCPHCLKEGNAALKERLAAVVEVAIKEGRTTRYSGQCETIVERVCFKVLVAAGESE